MNKGFYNKIKRISFLSVQILIFCCLRLYSQPSAEIYNIEVKNDTLDFGMCLVGDTLSSKFIITNTGDRELRMVEKDPSYYLGTIKGHGIEFDEFGKTEELPLSILQNSSDTLTIKFQPDDNYAQHPLGKKTALLRLGLFDPSQVIDPNNISDLVKYDTTVLVARKTLKYIDAYEKLVNFDSVYINPKDWFAIELPIQNVSDSLLSLDSDTLKMLTAVTTNPEFQIKKSDSLPLELPPKSPPVKWKILYYPRDLEPDSALYELYYKPRNKPNPDYIDTVSVKFYGIGVEQKIDLVSPSDATIKGDTLDIGEVWVGTSKEATAAVNNSGNIPFGILSQEMLEELKDSPSKYFSITDSLLENKPNLVPKNNSDFKVSFHPLMRGRFVARYVIQSDITNRNIRATPDSARRRVFYIAGTGIEPYVSFESDTIEFGDVTFYEGCPPSKTFTLPINNTGNATLRLSNFNVVPPFSVETPEIEIPAHSKGELAIVYSPLRNISRRDSAVLWFLTNANPPLDTLRFYLYGRGIPPIAIDLSIPKDLHAKPGNRLSVPLIVDNGEYLQLARTFDDKLAYNNTLMRYNTKKTLGTAAEGARIVDIRPDNESGILSVSVRMDTVAKFLTRDTIIVLIFDTYLGNSLTTEIAFTDPAFGNGPCPKVLSPSVSNGRFSLDSVCGLPIKINNNTESRFRLDDISPNPSNERIDVEFEVAFSCGTKVFIYNSYGEKVGILVDSQLKDGNYRISYNTAMLAPGLYFCEMQAGIFRKAKMFLIDR